MEEYISNEMMADYLTSVYENELVKKIISGAQSEGLASLYFQKLGNSLAKYYISTGDNTLEGINNVCNLFMQTYLNQTFDDQFMEFIISKCAKDKGIKHNPTVGEKAEIVNLVASRNINNSFYTHCFPGSLYSTVKQNGLDISNEMFKDELELLEKYFKTGFKTGKLCYCELSEASLSYATQNVPERVKFALGGSILFTKENKTESFLFSLRNNLIRLLQVGTLRKDDFYKVYEAGKKLIEFYCTNSQSAIAVFRKNNAIRKDYSISLFKTLNIDSNLRGTIIEKKLREIALACQNNPQNTSIILEDGLRELENISPELKSIAEKILNDDLIFQMKNRAVRNYMHGGYADGYEIESGKLSSADFAITLCPCPIDLWNEEHKNINDNPLINNPADAEEMRFNETCRRISAVEKILSKAAMEDIKPDNIECISFGKSIIPIYASSNNLVFPNNYTIGIQDGTYVISLFNEKVLVNRCIQAIRKEFLNDENKVTEIIEKYKATDNYDSDYEEDLEEDATLWFAKEIFSTYDEATKQQMVQSMAMKETFIGVTPSERGYVVSFGQEQTEVSKEVLVDINSTASYNNLYSQFIENQKNKTI